MVDNERELVEGDKFIIMNSLEASKRKLEIEYQGGRLRAYWQGRRLLIHDAAPSEGVYALQPVRLPAS